VINRLKSQAAGSYAAFLSYLSRMPLRVFTFFNFNFKIFRSSNCASMQDKAKNAQGASGSNANSSNPLKKPWVGVTGHQRNVKFMYYFVPILKGYRKMQLATRKLRKTLKPKVCLGRQL